jgi:Ca-activated chloride channel family protein
LEESIESYKETLRVTPNDKEARENLQKALLELKKKNPPKKQQEKEKKEQQKQQPKPKISPREAQQQLKLLEQKEKQVQERLQKNSKDGGSQPKDW